MTIWDALAVFDRDAGTAALWQLPALRVFSYRRAAQKTSGSQVLRTLPERMTKESAEKEGRKKIFEAPPAPMSGAESLKGGRREGFSTGDGRFSAAAGRRIRTAADAGERQLAGAVRLMREQGQNPEADTGRIFAELERRLLWEIGMG